MTIIVATRNVDKVKEIEAILEGLDISLSALDRFDHVPVIVEDGRTLEENALKKATVVRDLTGMCALADDTGLEVDALNGAPGVLSSRYAGEGAGYEANNRKLLEALAGVPALGRTARFRCVMALALSSECGGGVYETMKTRGWGEAAATEAGARVSGGVADPKVGQSAGTAHGARRVDAFVAEGILEGLITPEKRGTSGFGYDAVFEVPAIGKTLAELGTEGKNRISHRYRALVEIRELLLRWGLAKTVG